MKHARLLKTLVLFVAFLGIAWGLRRYENGGSGKTVPMDEIVNVISDSMQSAVPRDCSSTDSFALPAAASEPKTINGLEDLLASDFCAYLSCKVSNEWHDENMGPNSQEYSLSSKLGDKPTDKIGISVNNELVTFLMFSFHASTEGMCEGDKRLVASLLQGLHPEGDARSMSVTVINDMAATDERPIYEWGSYTLSAGYLPEGYTLLVRRRGR